MEWPTEISKDKLLLVEGNDQRNFLEALLKHIGITDDIQIMILEEFATCGSSCRLW